MDSETSTKPTKSRKQTIIPMVVEQVLCCDMPTLRLFGTHVNIVALVGIIRQISQNSAQEVSFNVEDHTGSIQAAISSETDQNLADQLESLEPGAYSKVFALFKGPGSPILVLKMFPIYDANAITNHLLEAMQVRLQAEQDYKEQLNAANRFSEHLIHDLAPNEEDNGMSDTGGRIDDELQMRVLHFIESNSNGSSKENVLKQFPIFMGQQVLQAMEHLINEGFIYCIQNGYYKAL